MRIAMVNGTQPDNLDAFTRESIALLARVAVVSPCPARAGMALPVNLRAVSGAPYTCDHLGGHDGRSQARSARETRAMVDGQAEEAAEKAVDPHRLLEGEDPNTTYLDDATHWVTVYSELLAVKRDLVAVSENRLPDMPKEARQEVATTDLVVLDTEMKRFSERLTFWHKRCVELGGSAPR